jgi:thiamine biosynthesis lipoprotein
MPVSTTGLGVAEWPVWTTTARLVVTEESALVEATAVVFEQLARVDAAANRFLAGSEVSRLARGTGAPAVVSPLLAELIGVALTAAAATGGAVDPTLGGPLLDLGCPDWAVAEPAGPDRPQPAGPDRPQPSVRRRTSWRDVRLDGRTVTLPAGTLLDLGATAKAHAADLCAVAIADRFGCGALVSLGGDLRAAGPPPDGGWQVLVRDGPDEPASHVRLAGAAAVATSSTLHRTWRQGGRVRHHVLDPATCRPAAPVWRTASVAADTCVRANTWSTAALVRGHAAERDLRRAGVAARLVAADGAVVRLGGWPA